MLTHFIGIDPAKITGWAIVREGALLASGVQNLRQSRFDSLGMRVVEFRTLLNRLNKSVDEPYEPMVVFEEVVTHQMSYRDKSGKVKHRYATEAAHTYGALKATIEEWCHPRQIPLVGVPVSTLKKFATGKGNANKSMMLSAAVRKWPDGGIDDHNQADAAFLALYGYELYGGKD